MLKFKCLFSVFIIAISSISFSQVSWLDQKDTTVNEGTISIQKDNRIDALIKFKATPIPPAFEPQMEGYRVQLFFDQERKNVNDARAKFMTIQRNVETYINFKAPNYNLTAGNFRDKLSAEKLRASISTNFPEAIVVSTKIYLPKNTTD
jgi:hypothetical protein